MDLKFVLVSLIRHDLHSNWLCLQRVSNYVIIYL